MRVTTNLTNSRVRKVDKLINQGGRSWNENLVKRIFMPHDADEILKIRLPRFDQEDFCSWTPNKHGLVNVRSAYSLALDLRNNTPKIQVVI
jgi:hypothetical protein